MAYAAVISLKNTMHRLKDLINIPQITKPAYDEELDSLSSMLKRLDDESSRMIDRSVINELDAKIREAVWKLEDVLDESSLSPNISPSQGHAEKSCSDSSEAKSKSKLLLGFLKKEEKSCCLGPLVDEMEMEMEMDLFLKTVKMLRKEYNRVLQNPLSQEEEENEALSAAVPPVNNSTTVGLSDLSQNIINQLLQSDPFEYALEPPDSDSERFISVVGMAGIGKTHLAALIYHHPRTVQHFHVRVWVRAGPKYQAHNIYADIHAQIECRPRDQFKGESELKLINLLESSLLGRRYLIVLDDIWTTQVFQYITPRLHRLGQFLITTRLHEVAEYRSLKIHEMPFLNTEDSWNLLRQNVFAEESFPPQLEEPGMKIAEKCEGLPLLILAVANILRGLDKTEQYWMKVADNKTTTFKDAYDQIYEVLLPSYEYLPQYLKACFLYMGVFPHSSEIPLSKLINLWIVEDFVEPSGLQNLEEFSMKSMEGLVSRSLAIVCKWGCRSVGRIRSSKLHSAYWYLCVTEAGKNKLFLVLNKLTDVISIERPRRLSVQNNILLGLKEVYDTMAAATSTTRSLLCTGENHQYPVPVCFNTMMLMRVLDALSIRFYEFPEEVVKLIQLRYLSLTHNGELPSSINKLQQLQCLILKRHHNIKFLRPKNWHKRLWSTKLVGDSNCLPKEIWDLQEMRHLQINASNLPNPRNGAKLPKLSTLYVNVHSCTKRVFRSIPHLKKLRIKIELQPDAAEIIRCFEHVRLLDELESLKCVVVNPRLRSKAVAPPYHLLNFPQSLKKLSLNGLGFYWKYMRAIVSLPWLQVLILRCYAFHGPHWETEFEQFKSLEFLLLEDIDLVHWTTGYYSFPSLRHLVVRHCYKLKKIPEEFGAIPSLEMIEVDDCSPSAVASAHLIKLKAEFSPFRRVSTDLQLVINSSWN